MLNRIKSLLMSAKLRLFSSMPATAFSMKSEGKGSVDTVEHQVLHIRINLATPAHPKLARLSHFKIATRSHREPATKYWMPGR